MRPMARMHAHANSARPSRRPAHHALEGQGEQDAAGDDRLDHEELTDPQRQGLQPVAEPVGGQAGQPYRPPGQSQHQTDAPVDGSVPVRTRVPLGLTLLQDRRRGVGEGRSERQQHGRHARWTVVSRSVRRSILIVSASMGAGHDGAAKELRRRLEASGHRVEVIDFLDAVAFHIGPLLRWFYQVQLRMAPWSYELSYKMAPLLRAPAVMLDTCLTRRKLKRAIKDFRPDAVVSVYPLASLVLGRMRRKKQLRVPVVTFLTDFAVHSLVGAPWDRPPPGGERDLGGRRRVARRQGRPGPRAAGERALPGGELRPRGRAQQPRPLARRPRRARRRRLVGRGRRRRHRRGHRRKRRVPPHHRVRARRQPPGRARDAGLRHRDRLDRPDAGAHVRVRRAGRERRRPHLHGGVRGRAAGHHLQADRRARQGQRGDDGPRRGQLLRARRGRAARDPARGHPSGPGARRAGRHRAPPVRRRSRRRRRGARGRRSTWSTARAGSSRCVRRADDAPR